MGRSSVLTSLLALLVGVVLGAAALSWWEGGRQNAEIESLKVRLADERGQVQTKVKQLGDERWRGRPGPPTIRSWRAGPSSATPRRPISSC